MLMKHQTLINALARQGLNPERDPNDESRFVVHNEDVTGTWEIGNPHGQVFVAVTRENDQVKWNASVSEFLKSLKKPLTKAPYQTKNRKNMH